MARTSSGYVLQVSAKVDTSTIKTQLDTFAKSYSFTIKTNISDTGGLNKLNNTVKSTSSNINTLNTQTVKLESNMAQMSTTSVSGLNSINKSTKNVASSFLTLFKNQAKMQSMQLILIGVKQAFVEAFTTVKEFDDALTELKKVSDLSGDSLQEYTERLGELGEAVARTRTEMVEAAQQFVKSGFTEDEAAQLAVVASLFQNIADSEIESADAASFITSQLYAFNVEAEDSITIIDAINEVSNNFAVSSTDISTALSKTSAAMGVLGNTFEETIGLVTAGTEIMQGQASKVARG